MRAYKFTADDAVSVFTRFPWPVPARGKPGAWVDAAITAKVCETGVHACRVADLPYWLGRELREVELGGDVVAASYKLVARRAGYCGASPAGPSSSAPSPKTAPREYAN